MRKRRLIGVVGPIGAGKSTILDAISFALYGRTPRVGRDTKSLIHQRAPHCAVELRFEVDGQIWEAVRNIRRQGQAQHALYRYETEDAVEPVEKVVQERPMAERVEELLGLDYDAFSKSVLLAQGEFDHFLRADPRERDRVLKGVFGLDRIDQIRSLAQARVREGDHRLELISVQLQQVELARAELPEHRRRLLDLGQRIALLEKAEPTLVELQARQADAGAEEAAAGERLRELDRLGSGLPSPGEIESMEEAAIAAAEERAAKAKVLEQAHRAAEEAERTLREPEFVAMLAAIDQARAVSARLAEARKSRTGAEARLEEDRLRAAAARGRAAEAEDARVKAEAAVAKSIEDLERDRAAVVASDARVHAARHADMAAALRRGIEVGDPCPVCGQAVQQAAAPAPDSDLDDAESEAVAARSRLEQSTATHTAAVGEHKAALKGEEERAAQASDALERAARTEGDLASAVEHVRVTEDELTGLLGEGDPEVMLALRKAEAAKVESTAAEARAKREDARRQHDIAIEAEQQSGNAMAEARSRLAVLAAGLKVDLATEVTASALAGGLRAEWERQTGSAKSRESKARSAIDAAKQSEARILRELGVEDGGFERGLAEARAESAVLDRQVIAAETLIDQSEAQLGEQAAILAGNQLLRRITADLTDAKFVRFLLDEERRALAGIGSEHFERLSSGRYRFTDDGDFMVVDQTAADSTRRADSLSGGETFLASLGLALGLAEMVGREGGRLDAFFLDEGFGSLDAEHLDLAMEGIEALVNDRRLVIVVSHVEGVRSRIDDLIALDRDPLTGDSIVRAGAVPS